MIHLGDITKIDWAQVEPVDCVTGGSPCQDLSVAGKRAGLAGERSGLYMEQIRCVKELRKYDRLRGRAGIAVRPRYMVWENVPGAFSSNGGEDFRAVLEEIVRVCENEVPDLRTVVQGGWTKAGCLYSDLGDWSVAWRVHDAQFWGVPQRRKRISVVADFGGLSAPEILFERKGLSRDSEPGGTPGEETAGATGGGTEGASKCYGLDHVMLSGGTTYQGRGYYNDVSGCLKTQAHGVLCLNDQGGSVMDVSEEKTGTLRAQDHGHPPLVAGFKAGQSRDSVFCIQGNCIDRADTAGCNGRGWTEDVSYTLNTIDRPAVAFAQNQRNEVRDLHDVAGALAAEPGMKQQTYVMAFKQGQGSKAGGIGAQEECSPTLSAVASGTNQVPAIYDARGNGNGATVPTLTGDHQNRVTDYTALCVGNGQINQISMSEQANTLDTMHDQQAVMVTAVDCRNLVERKEVSGTLQCKENGGYSLNYQNPVKTQNMVRRLTPLECERLQGYPDGWTDIGDWTDSKGKRHKAADSPRYKALGNSIALPFWFWLLRRISAQYERPATLGSLFDGIGGFPLCWERCNGKGTARWASEIEEFPMAVTKIRFPEEDNK